MINKAIAQITPAITSMAWIDRYGGLTFTASRTENTESGTKEVLYPVSHVGSAQNCFESGDYLRLVPNSSFNTVSYFEQIGEIPISESNHSARHKMYDFNASLRFVCWLNLKKMGIDNFTTAYMLKLQTLNRLKKAHPTTTEIQQLEISNIQIENKNTTIDLFNRYSYANVQKLTLFPYDVFSIRFNVSWKTPLNCITDFVPGASIDC